MKLLVSTLLIFLCSTICWSQADAPPAAITISGGALFGTMRMNDAQAGFYNRTRQGLVGGSFSADAAFGIPHLGKWGVNYAGELGYDAGNARIVTNSVDTTRREKVSAQLHNLTVGYEPTARFRLGAGYFYATEKRQWQTPSDNHWDNTFTGWIIGGSGFVSPNNRLTFDYRLFGAPWARRKEVSDLNSVTTVRGVPVQNRILKVSHYRSPTLDIGGGGTYWFKPGGHFGVRGGLNYLRSWGSVPQVSGREVTFSRLTGTAQIVYEF